MWETKIHRRRIRILIGIFIGTAFLVVGRLFYLQILHSADYKERAENQYTTSSTDTFDRGNIYFTAKDGTTVTAATVVSGFKLVINPTLITDPEHTYAALNAVIPIDHATFIAKATKENDQYEEIVDHIEAPQADALTKLALPGVTLKRENWRFYPGGELAARTIGFVSYKGDTLTGTSGLEQYYNDVLSRASDDVSVNFFAQIFANMTSSFKNTSTEGDIVTSIEPTVQAQLEQTVTSIQQKWDSDTVGGIIMDPYTGEIIAMAAAPSFDLNNFTSVKDQSIYTNPFVQNRYEMGSIVKPLIMSGAIENNVVTPSTTYTDHGSVTVNGTTLSNFDKMGRGANVTMQEVLNQSLNTGMIFVEQHMGKAMFKDYVENHFHLGDKTGVDLPGEVNGAVGSLDGSNDINYAAAAFGQGIATSPINIVRGFAVLANGGILVTPHLATAVVKESGTTVPINY
ncbi:MAG TPA: penicillin-binding transpeptidase domain-containing protein, partial [Candidatus Paceibacterota bacterium]|nr:penicillin-binding transpeptidase domain-containing protein [Candidatus Paceibacterota bacterium]